MAATETWSVEKARAYFAAQKGGAVAVRPLTETEGRLKTWKGWLEIGGKRHYYKSRWEANWACYCEFRKKRGEIADWHYEPDTFEFPVKRGVTQDTPDFRITLENGKVFYEEVKGYLDAKSKTRLNRMKKYHPDVELNVVDGTRYRSVQRTLGFLVPGWVFKK